MPEVRATYRLQLHAGFPLAARARARSVPRAGSASATCTARRCSRSRRGSTHGYDVVDPAMLDPGARHRAELAALHESSAAHGMGIVLDIVPNHMAASAENPAWDDVLAHGPASPLRPLVRHRLAGERAGAARPGAAARPRAPRAPPCSSERRSASLRSDGVPRVATSSTRFPLDPLDDGAAAGERGRRLRAGARRGRIAPCTRADRHRARVSGGFPRRQRRTRGGRAPPSRQRARRASGCAGWRGRSRAWRRSRAASEEAVPAPAATGDGPDCAGCSTPRSTGWCTGAARRGRSTTAASST